MNYLLMGKLFYSFLNDRDDRSTCLLASETGERILDVRPPAGLPPRFRSGMNLALMLGHEELAHPCRRGVPPLRLFQAHLRVS